MFRVTATSSNNSLLSAPEIKPLDQPATNDSLLQKTTSCAKKTFLSFANNFKRGFLIAAVVITPLEALKNWAFNIKEEEGSIVDQFRKLDKISGTSFFSSSFGAFVVYGTVMVLLPIAEEIIFRGYIQSAIKKRSKDLLSKNVSFQKEGKDEIYSSKISKIAGSIIFGCAHLSVLAAISIGITSYFLESTAYEKDGLAGSIGIHMGHNAMNAVMDCVTFLRKSFFLA